MDRDVYQRLDSIEANHWWFTARRRILRSVITRFGPAGPGLRVLEAGCGTGGNLAMLGEIGRVDAFESDEGARLAACAKTKLTVRRGALPDDIPFAGHFDIIAVFDVLEHVERDVESLAKLARLLAPSGRLYLTVPALPWLWSHHDETHHHYRRYTRRQLIDCLRRASLTPIRVTYFNSLLFPVIAAWRLLHRAGWGKSRSEDVMPPAPLNWVLAWIFGGESLAVGRVPLPIGISLLAIAEYRP
jgi:SAM-dependent methyltransferase